MDEEMDVAREKDEESSSSILSHVKTKKGPVMPLLPRKLGDSSVKSEHSLLQL